MQRISLIVPLLLLIGDLFYLTIKRSRVNRCDGMTQERLIQDGDGVVCLAYLVF